MFVNMIENPELVRFFINEKCPAAGEYKIIFVRRSGMGELRSRKPECLKQ